ncbi:MAG: cytochrome c oxidase accessory protein CcoG [Marinilabiliales bacterium]|nr:cytochrome c oxidase accessory protein CcoG [Marinilabiliales bacterium]
MTTPAEEDFRDHPIYIDESGQRKRIHAKQPVGKWYNRRRIVGWVFILFLIFAPILKINGHPLMLLDIAHRQFYLFGKVIWAMDTYILALVMAVTVVSIVLFTVVFGRLWCGWACPQTVFLEMIYRPVEYLFEGNGRGAKVQRSESERKVRLIAKHIVFFLISVFFANVFLMWFMGPEALIRLISEPISQHQTGFILMLIVSAFYYWIYGFFREQVCSVFCPYGRMQGVLLDSRSVSVIYDFKRGEPRNPKVHEGGDCINCRQCIAVCPTGIDIRNGSQLECIHCAACIDECNLVMKKIGKPGNLIRYDSYQGVESGVRNLFNFRSIAYSMVLFVLVAALAITASTRSTLDVTLWRVQGTLFQQLDPETFSNLYNLMVINKSGEEKNLSLKPLENFPAEITIPGDRLHVNANGKSEAVVIIKLKKSAMKGKGTSFHIGLFNGDQLVETIQTNFIGPDPK